MGGYMSTEKSETDVLVVGSGAAGLFAAIRAKETGARVIVVEKGQSGFSGASAYGPQFIRIIFPGDDYDKSAKQTIVWRSSRWLEIAHMILNAKSDLCFLVLPVLRTSLAK
jgi:succinate dehydrogenase/fumarate reductase flavoprotein subunit